MVMVVVIQRGKHKYNTRSEEMNTLERDMLRYTQGKTADVIARAEEPPSNGLYAPLDMHHYLQRKIANAIARGEEPPYGGLYGPSANPCVANPPTKKGTKKDKPSSSLRKDN
jgi:hypothetical protein